MADITNAYQQLRPSQVVAPTLQVIDSTTKKIINDIYCSGSSSYNLSSLFRFLDFDPERGYKYTLVGTGSFYAWPKVKPGSYLVSRKHHDIPILEKQIKGQLIIATSFSTDAFDTKVHTIPDYYSYLFTAIKNSVEERLNFIAYLLFKGDEGKYKKNTYFEEIIKTNYDPSNANANGYPMYSMTFTLDEATNKNFKVTNNELKTQIESVRGKIKTNKVEIDTTKLKEELLVKNIGIDENNKEYFKYALMRLKLEELVEDIYINPQDYAINKANLTKFRYPIKKEDLIIIVPSSLSFKWKNVVTFNKETTGAGDNGTLVPSNVISSATVLDYPHCQDDEILIAHKDAISIFVNGRYTNVHTGKAEDPKIINWNSTLALHIGTVDDLPCVTLKFKS